MSLTSHLKDSQSPIYQFMRRQFPYTRALVQETNKKLREASTIKPIGQIPYSTIGTALDYRIRYYFAAAPNESLVAWNGANLLRGTLIRTAIDSSGEMRIPPLDSELYEAMRIVGESAPEFFENLTEILNQVQPVGRRLHLEHEKLIARYCIGLALLEQVFRVGTIPSRSPLIFPSVVGTADELLACVQKAWIDDLCYLSYAFYDSHSEILSRPSILNPIFDGSLEIGGADADLIVDNRLIDIKTTINPKLSASWLYQLLGYVLLDYSNRYKIQGVAIYYARQEELTWWTLDNPSCPLSR